MPKRKIKIKKRILMISSHGYFEAHPFLGHPDTGGQVVFVIELSNALARFGYKVDILTRQFEKLSQIEKINKDVRIIRIPCGGKEFIPKEYLIERLPELINRFVDYCKKNNLKYEFINSHYWDAGFVGSELEKIFNIPHIFTPHSLGIWKKRRMRETYRKKKEKINEEDFEKKYNFKTRNKTEKMIMEKADKIIATTPIQKEIISRDYKINKRKLVVITPGFNSDKYNKIDKKLLKKVIKREELPEKFVLTVGRSASNKGYDLLIKAMKYVIDQVADVELILAIGSRKPLKKEIVMKKELTEMAEKLNISKKIIFLGYLSDLEYYYSAARVFVLASTYEPFGMTAIEAMACGTPVVVTDKGGLKYFLKNRKNAIIVNPFETKKMAKEITLLLKDKKLHNKISQEGYKKAHSTFSWDIIVRKTLKVIKELQK